MGEKWGVIMHSKITREIIIHWLETMDWDSENLLLETSNILAEKINVVLYGTNNIAVVQCNDHNNPPETMDDNEIVISVLLVDERLTTERIVAKASIVHDAVKVEFEEEWH